MQEIRKMETVFTKRHQFHNHYSLHLQNHNYVEDIAWGRKLVLHSALTIQGMASNMRYKKYEQTEENEKSVCPLSNAQLNEMNTQFH